MSNVFNFNFSPAFTVFESVLEERPRKYFETEKSFSYNLPLLIANQWWTRVIDELLTLKL